MVSILDGKKKTIDYTSQDFADLVSDLQSYVSSNDRFPNADFNEGSILQLLIELFASVGDRIFASLDRLANETNLVTAKRLRNIINLSRGNYGYIPKIRTPAIGIVEVVPVSGSIFIPRGTIFSTSFGVQFYSVSDFTVSPSFTNVTVCDSLFANVSFVSTGLPNQKFKLNNTPYSSHPNQLVIINSQTWTRVDNFFGSTPSSTHYMVITDDLENGCIVFGDGVNGLIPIANVGIFVEYYYGGLGAFGNVPANSVVFADLNTSVNYTLTNSNAITGGSDSERTYEIVGNAIRYYSSVTVTVSKQDVVNNAMSITGVSRAVVRSSDDSIVYHDNYCYLYVVPDPLYVFNDIKNDIKDYFIYVRPLPLTMNVVVKEPIYVTVKLICTIYVSRNFDFQRVIDTVGFELSKFFDPNTLYPDNINYTLNFNEPVRWSKVLDLIHSVESVKYIQNFYFDGYSCGQDVPIGLIEFPKYDSSNFNTVGGVEFVQA
jgi:hypothetical protein